MSLLMLKTKDLTHQDHILNFELMLNPTGSGLLLNKHRSLESKRDKEKEICEVERQFALKNFQIEKRLIERRQSVLRNRAVKRTYYVYNKPESSGDLFETKVAKVNEKKAKAGGRAHSAPPRGRRKGGVKDRVPFRTPVNTFQTPLSTNEVAQEITRGRSAAFRTFGTGPESSAYAGYGKLQTASSITSGRWQTSPSEDHSTIPGKSVTVVSTSRRCTSTTDRQKGDVPGNKALSKTSTTTSRVPATKALSKNAAIFLTQNIPDQAAVRETGSVYPWDEVVEEDEPQDTSRNDTCVKALQKEGENRAEINGRVGEFLTRVNEFKSRPVSHDKEIHELNPWVVKVPTKVSTATVAKRYNQLSLDIEKLHSAFDKLCVERNPEELQKIVKLASKLKANVRNAKNVSFAPVMGTLRSVKRFRENVSR